MSCSENSFTRLPASDARPQSTVAGRVAPLIEVQDAHVQFGGVRALAGVSCAVYRNEICGLIGPNGAGKTTLFNCITRLYDLTAGSITFTGQRIDRLSADQIIRLGIARTFQNLGLYTGMTVLENVALGAHHRYRTGFVDVIARPWLADAEEKQHLEECRAILDELDLARVAEESAGNLPFGSLKRVEIARALASHPQLLLLDEPAAGLTHSEVARFGRLIERIRKRFEVTVLLVEHNMNLVMELCGRLLVLNFGQLLAEGTFAEIRRDPAVISAYLGETL